MIQKEPIIQVGILTSPEIKFVLNEAYSIDNKKTYFGHQKVSFLNGKVSFAGELYDELIFSSEQKEASFDLIDVVIGISFHWERKENQRFVGELKIIVEGNQITAINCVRVEDYLTSVISSEMSANASEELLKAHAVISRSWLLFPMQEQKVKPKVKSQNTDDSQLPTTNHIIKWYERDTHVNFDVCADDHCQRYQGITRATTAAVVQAIEATRGEVLMYENEICDARFSKSCGGVTETFENCWAPENFPYLSKIIDNLSAPEGYELDLTIETNAESWIRYSPEAFCNTTDAKILSQVLNNYDQETTDFYRWKVTYTQAEISELLVRKSGIDFGKIVDLIPLKRGESARIVKLKIVGTKQTIIVGKELEIRKWLSESHLYSSAFVMDKLDIENSIPQQFCLTGAGWGHGVGLCQIGAAVMGEKGYKYNEILLHYFKDAELKRIY
ncbi:MAG: amidase [Porphyromonadaceae bacterium CG2_30_38_12]|nr:MAG: amidase [Porphyromonadaceae bacterium CG2_30_38_12]